MTAKRVGAGALLVTFVLATGLLVQFNRAQAAGPAHVDLTIGEGIPATIYVPGDSSQLAPQALPEPESPGLPVVVLGHGFGADRATMSTLARSLAAAGYAVVAFDFRGHGENRNGFTHGELRADIDAVVSWAETSPHIDPDRIIVMGHSMGAGAALDFATQDPRPAAVVPISGGNIVDGPHRPDNVLFIAAANEPPWILDEHERLSRRLAGTEVEVGSSVEDADAGGTVARIEVPGTDHVTVLYADQTVAELVAFMDGITDLERDQQPGRVDDRLLTAGLYLLAALVLMIGLGIVVGQLAPVTATGTAGPILPRLGVVAAGLLVATPFGALAPPTGFVPLAAGDAILGYAAVAGGLLLIARSLHKTGRLPLVTASWLGADRTWLSRTGSLPQAVTAGLVGFAGVYLLLAPLGPVMHRLVPTPERLLAGVVAAALYLPLFLALELLTRRGRPLPASLTAVGGKVALLIVLALSLWLDLVPGVVSIFLPFLVALFAVFELIAAPIYIVSRNLVTIAVMQAALLGWFTAVIMPLN